MNDYKKIEMPKMADYGYSEPFGTREDGEEGWCIEGGEDAYHEAVERYKASLTYPLYESPKRAENEDKYGHTTGNQCICCMKPMKSGETKWVHMNEAWRAVRTDIDESDFEAFTGAASQGCFNIGDACAKKMPKEFIIDNWDSSARFKK